MAKHWISIFTVLFLQVTYAKASPIVTVTVKNQGALPIINKSISINHQHTLLNASPKPKARIMPGKEDTFAVDNKVGDGANYAEVYYMIGERSCNFKSLFVNKRVGYKTYIPQWFKFTTSQDGAHCSAEIANANSINHSWHVVFVIK